MPAMRGPRPGTFERLASEVLVANPWHSYRHDAYTLADGRRGDYYYVDVPGSAGIVPLFDDGTTVLLEVYRYLLGTYLWELPIGGTRRGEENSHPTTRRGHRDLPADVRDVCSRNRRNFIGVVYEARSQNSKSESC